MNIVAKPLLNITEAFELLSIGQAIEVNYSIGSVRNVKKKSETVLKRKYKVLKSRESGKPCIVRVA